MTLEILMNNEGYGLAWILVNPGEIPVFCRDLPVSMPLLYYFPFS